MGFGIGNVGGCDGQEVSCPPPTVRIPLQRISTDRLSERLARRPSDAATWIRRAAEAGLTPAQVVWGQLLLDGHFAPRDSEAAFVWFSRAAAASDAEGCNMVGRCYEQGWGVAVDRKRATAAFESAAEAGDVWGKVNLAQMLMSSGDPEARPRCLALFKAAAEGGTGKANIKAMNWLARFLEEGWASPPDPDTAATWYLKAADLGDHWAQYNLATLLVHQGDLEAAGRWLRRAVAEGDNGFRRRIAPLLLAQSEAILRQRGLDALALCATSGAEEDFQAFLLAIGRDEADRPQEEPTKSLPCSTAAKRHAPACAAAPSKGAGSRPRGPLASVLALASRLAGSTAPPEAPIKSVA